MRYKQFGKEGLRISEIAIGTWGAGGHGWGGSDKAACISAIHTMIDLGVNLIDTAPIYGRGLAEEVTAEAVKGKRQNLIISTKCGLKLDAKPGEEMKVATRAEVINGCEASLRRLGTDYIDILFVHWPDNNTPVEETLEAMNFLKEQGKIRCIGLSNFSIPQIEDALKYSAIEIIQPPYSMVDQSAKEIMLWCHKKKIASMTYASLGAGILGGKIRTLTEFGKGDVRGGFYDYFREPKFSKVMELLKLMDTIAEKRNVPVSQVAINWVVQKEFVLTALVGVRTDSHAKENCGAADWQLDAAELALLDAEVNRLF
ncbi:MAG: aldo/keto reductase [Treponema sp.]|jgi:aryl-alcohol dehydrogenase-like predicted oxidoreductase|nr:aldo/keto reductase [Treponema sp.]